MCKTYHKVWAVVAHMTKSIVKMKIQKIDYVD